MKPNNFSVSRRACLTLLGASSLGLVRAQQQTASGSVLRLGFIGPTKKQRPASATGYALAQGYLQRELAPLGYTDITTHEFPNGPDLNEAFLSGALDVGIYGDTPAVVARSRGLQGRLIGFDNIGLNVWLLTPVGGIKDVRELEGKVLAVPLGSYMHRYVIGLLKEAGLQKSTRVVYMLPRDGESALAKNSIAAFAAPINTGPLLAAKGYPVIDEAVKRPALLGSSVIVAADKTLLKAPDLAHAWQRARTAAIRDIRRDPEKYYAFHADVSGFPLQAIKASYPLSQFPDELYPAAGLRALEEVKSFLLAENLIRQDFPISSWAQPTVSVAQAS